MKPILEVKNLWKSYQIGAKQERYLSLRDSMVGFLKNGWQRKETFWALQDLSFEVYPGDTLGIIGRNGAGKTTLLKILSRITPPTKGSITVRGRLASLLEVGTGFHPELTGRENIFLNGAILGLKRQEIKQQFDAIVDFSGVEQFLDTPLKHYSSGMQLRLAFAVAAHLEPEILLIDEVLAVGDAEFQKRCLGKMDEVARSGRTVVFVSHDLGAIQQLCKKCICLKNGKIALEAPTNDCIKAYFNKILLMQDSKLSQNEKAEISVYKMRYFDEAGDSISSILLSEKIRLEITLAVKKKVAGAHLSLILIDHLKRRIFNIEEPLEDLLVSNNENLTIKIAIPSNYLMPGKYSWDYAIHIPHVRFIDKGEDFFHFDVLDSGSKFSKYKTDNGLIFPTYTIKLAQ